MIAENMIYFAIGVFVLMVIGLVLTYVEFRYGNPRKQQEIADKQQALADPSGDSVASRPAH